jgi:uncharacterized membrane protein YbhN (UPF0104 family)
MKAVSFYVALACLLVLVSGQFVSVHPRVRGPFELMMLAVLIVFGLSSIGWMLLKGRGDR